MYDESGMGEVWEHYKELADGAGLYWVSSNRYGRERLIHVPSGCLALHGLEW
jgi:hypothetical protein